MQTMTMEPPESLPERLRSIWAELAPTVQQKIGAAGMEALCGQVYRLREAERSVSEDGMVVANAKGDPGPHPALSIERQAQIEIRAWMEKYGVRR